MTFAEWIASYDACKPSMEWLDDRTAEQAWNECKRGDWLIWWLAQAGLDDATLRLLACDMVRRTPLADGRTVWDLLTDECSRNAVVVAERHAVGKATIEELAAASNAAWDIASSAASSAAASAASSAAASAAWAAVGDAAWAAAWAAAWGAAAAAAAARADQCDIIRERVSWDMVKELMESQGVTQ